MLMPKKTKYRVSMEEIVLLNLEIKLFWRLWIVGLNQCWMTQRQIESARRAMTRYIKRGGKAWIRIFPDKSVTKIPAETRMGKGKGLPEYWVAVVKPGHMLFELSGVSEEVAREAFRLASHKLPIKTKFVKKEVWD